MPLNPNIILGVQRPKFTSPQELYAQKAQVEQNALASRMGNMQLQRAEQEQADSQTERDIYSKFGADTSANQNMLMQAGLGKQALAYGKTVSDAAKSKVESEKAQVEKALKVFEMSGQIMSGVSDQATWDRARQQTAEVFGPEAAAKMPAQYDPALVDQKRNQALSVKEQLEQKWKAMEYTTPNANARLSADTSRQNNAASVGASYANAAATRAVAASNVEAAKIKGDRDTEMKIADDYRAQSKTFKEVSDAYKTINATLDKATTSAAATLAGATKFMKLLDPGSVVRESELGMALAATGALDRATNYFNTLKFGKVLTKAQAEDFKNITAQIYAAAQSQQKAIDQNYTQQAKTYGLRPEMIVQDLGQNAPAAGAPSANIDALLDKYK